MVQNISTQSITTKMPVGETEVNQRKAPHEFNCK